MFNISTMDIMGNMKFLFSEEKEYDYSDVDAGGYDEWKDNEISQAYEEYKDFVSE